MSWKIMELVQEIENAIFFEYCPEAIAWADKHFNCAWSNAIDRFEDAINQGLKTKNWEYVQFEADLYKNTIFDLLNRYKKTKGIDERESLLKAIEEKWKDEP